MRIKLSLFRGRGALPFREVGSATRPNSVKSALIRAIRVFPSRNVALVRIAGLALGLGWGGAAWAQAAPDAGSLLRDLNRTTPQLTRPPVPAQPILPDSPAPLVKDGQTVTVTDFRIRSTLFPEATLKEVVKGYVGRACTLGDLQEAAGKISQYYRDHDYIARAYLPRQTIKDGVVEIVVVEGRLGKVTAEPADRSEARLRPDVAAGTVLARQPVGEPLRPSALENALADLNALPGVKAAAVLEGGKEEGETDVRVALEDTPLVSGLAQVDNASVRSVGRERGVVSAAVNDPAGFGDQATVTAVKSQGSEFGRLSFAAPIGYSGLNVGINGSALHYAVGARINVSRPQGEAATGGITANYPLYRSQTAVVQAEAAYDHKRLVNSAADQTIGNNRVDVGSLGFSGSANDPLLGGGLDSFTLTGSLGRLALLDDTGDPLRTKGIYEKTMMSAGRVSPLPRHTDLVLSLAGQWASKNLDSSEKFALGGPTAIRAYPVNEASGDEGAVASIELRHAPMDKVLVSAFYDAGLTLQQVHPLAGDNTPNCYALQGIGASLGWSPVPAVQAKATIAERIGPNPGADAAGNDSEGEHGRTRLWFQLSSSF